MSRQSQPRVALQYANVIRLAQGDLKRRVAAGDLLLDDALQGVGLTPEEHDALSRMTVFDLLCAAKHVGVTRARGVLSAKDISETMRVGHLTDRQRKALVRGVRWRIPRSCAHPSRRQDSPCHRAA